MIQLILSKVESGYIADLFVIKNCDIVAIIKICMS